MKSLVVFAAFAAASAACSSDVDEQWDLDHDRIIAVRASKPGLLANEQAELTGLIGRVGDKTVEQSPQLAGVVAPMSLAATVTSSGGHWFVTAPSDASIAAARVELGLAADAPVPLQVGISFGSTLNALTTIRLGIAADNPPIAMPMVNGVAAVPATELVVGSLVDVPLAVTVAEKIDVNWLTSCGTMHDFDLPNAYLRVEAADSVLGELAVVVRDRLGGVAWQVWPIHAQ